MLKWPSLILKKSPSFIMVLSTTPPNILTNTLEDSILLKIWKKKERTSLSTLSKNYIYEGVFILNKLKRSWSLSQSFQHHNHPKRHKSMKESSTKSNLCSNHYGDVRSHCRLPCYQPCWSLVQQEMRFWAHCFSLLLKSSVDGSVIQWLIIDIHYSWNTVELFQPLLVDIHYNGGAPNTTCITSSQTVNFTTMILNTTTKSTFTNSYILNGDLIHWSKLLVNWTT